MEHLFERLKRTGGRFQRTVPTTLLLNMPSKKGVLNKDGLVQDTNLAAFHSYIAGRDSVMFIDGTSRAIDNKPEILAGILKAHEAAWVGMDHTKAKDILDKMLVKTPEGVCRVYDIDKDFIGLTKIDTQNTPGGGGGANKYNQGLQCIISACIENSIKPSAKNYQSIRNYVDLGNVLIGECFNTADAGWMKSAIMSHRAIRSMFGKLPGYVWHEESSGFSSRIYGQATLCFRNSGAGRAGDRWNPADIWAVKSEQKCEDLFTTQTVGELNKVMLELWDEGILYGISLKKVETPKKRQSLTMKSRPTGKAKLSNHPSVGDVKIPNEFGGKLVSELNQKTPFKIGEGMYWASDSSTDRMHLATYGAKVSAGMRISTFRIGIRSKSGGLFDGTIMGQGITPIVAKYGIQFTEDGSKAWSVQWQQQYATKNEQMFGNFATWYTKHANNGSYNTEQMIDLCYKDWPIDLIKGPTFDDYKGFKPASTYMHVWFAEQCANLSESDLKKMLAELDHAISSEDNASVYVKIGTK